MFLPILFETLIGNQYEKNIFNSSIYIFLITLFWFVPANNYSNEARYQRILENLKYFEVLNTMNLFYTPLSLLPPPDSLPGDDRSWHHLSEHESKEYYDSTLKTFALFKESDPSIIKYLLKYKDDTTSRYSYPISREYSPLSSTFPTKLFSDSTSKASSPEAALTLMVNYCLNKVFEPEDLCPIFEKEYNESELCYNEFFGKKFQEFKEIYDTYFEKDLVEFYKQIALKFYAGNRSTGLRYYLKEPYMSLDYSSFIRK